MNVNEMKIEAYETPMVEIVEVEVEKVFAVNDPSGEGVDFIRG